MAAQTDTGNAETVESHGAALSIDYVVQDVSGSWTPGESIPANVASDVLVEGTLANADDDIAASTLVSHAIPADVAWWPASALLTPWRIRQNRL
jgi:hypothetical protein